MARVSSPRLKMGGGVCLFGLLLLVLVLGGKEEVRFEALRAE